MAIRQSTGLRDFIGGLGSYKHAFFGGILKIYSGTQPTSADDAVAGTLLVSITNASGAHTNEVLSSGSVQITNPGAGTVNYIYLITNAFDILGATITYASSAANTAALCAAQINKYCGGAGGGWKASAVATDVITIYAPRGTGTAWNTKDITANLTTLTSTDANFSGGVAHVNGLQFAGPASSGKISKDSLQTWSGVAGNTGTAGWFRLCAAIADAGSSSTTLLRLDGSIATSGADLNLASTTITAAATVTIDQFDITVPANA